MNPRRPVFDPFADSNPLAGRQAALAPEGPLKTSEPVRGTTTAGVSNLVGYRDAGEMVLGNGRGMGAALPGSFMNSGTVIPHAGLGGVPNGVRIHDTQSLQVNVDPHLEARGQRATVNLRDVPRFMAQAQALAAETTPEPSDVGSMRTRAATTFQEIAHLAQQEQAQLQGQPQGQPHGQPLMSVQQAAPQYLPSNQFTTQQPQPARQVRPLQMFAQTQSVQPQQFVPRVVDTQAVSVPERPMTPQYEVTFEIEQFGNMVAMYHDVVLLPGVLILVHAVASPGRMYQPPHGQQTPPMAVAIAGHSRVYLVHSTGIHYAYDKYEFCVLLIDQEAPLLS